MARLDLFRAGLALPDPPALPAPTTAEPPKDHDIRRGLVDLRGTIAFDDRPVLTIDEARAEIRERMSEYLAMSDPGYILLVALPPGSGKTTEAVRQAEIEADLSGKHILFAGARHNMWDDIRNASTLSPAKFQQFWYHWQPHQLGDSETGQGQTCRYTNQFMTWVGRGHQGIDFCKQPRVCGWDYIKESCPYHRQAHQPQPIVFVQHAHIALGHKLLERSAIVIGDESPLDAFLHAWRIAPRDIVPPDLADYGPEARPNVDLIELTQALRGLVDQAPPLHPETKRPLPAWEGPALLERLGGAQHVAAVCADHGITASDRAYVPQLWGPDQADQVPCWYLDHLIPILAAEAREALAGNEYITRVRVSQDGLTLLLRRPHQALPPHVIWMDATANPYLYRDIFGRDIKVVAPRVQMAGTVYQVYARLNNKDRLVGGGSRQKSKRVDHTAERALIKQQVAQIVRRGKYQNPAIVTFKAIVDDDFGAFPRAHFGGLRGTNRLQACDALIVVGTPSASLTALRDQAAMLLPKRMRPFDLTWSDRTLSYPGQAYGYDVSGFWHDKTLQALLEDTREAELVQAAHRVRPLFRPVDVWLLTNLPLTDLPPNVLLSLTDLFESPKGVEPYRWPEVLALVESAGEDGISAEQLHERLKVPARTAERWFAALCAYPGIEVRKRATNFGRPARVCVKRFSADFPPRGYK